MSLKTDGSIFIFSSPSGAGKTTLVKLVSKKKILLHPYLTQQENQEATKLTVKDYYFVNDENLKT